MQNGVVSGVLITATNWVVTESCIDKNWKLKDWKLKDWNEKMWKLEG